jgi:hypothetical protein
MPYAKIYADLMSMKEPCNGTCDAWGSVGHGQQIVLVHCERKPKCASKGTRISMKSAKIVHFQSMRDTRVFLEMSVCFLTIIYNVPRKLDR